MLLSLSQDHNCLTCVCIQGNSIIIIYQKGYPTVLTFTVKSDPEYFQGNFFHIHLPSAQPEVT